MIDLHMHIIPGVDDGAESFEESEKLLLQAIGQGVEAIIATPHSKDAFFKKSSNTYKQYYLLNHLIESKGLNIKVYLGSEVRCKVSNIDKILKALKTGEVPSLNNTRYVLVELCEGHIILSDKDMFKCTDRLIEEGWIPVIAHAERYHLSTKMIKDMKRRGCYIQINMYSIVDESNEKIRNNTENLLKEKLVDFVGTDAHRVRKKKSGFKTKQPRPVKVENAISYLYKNYEKDYIDDILYRNAKNRILKGTL